MVRLTPSKVQKSHGLTIIKTSNSSNELCHSGKGGVLMSVNGGRYKAFCTEARLAYPNYDLLLISSLHNLHPGNIP
jgi:hypothetical protein